MNRLIYILLFLMVGCETGQVINNAKPEDISKAVNNISAAAETVTRTWVPWYFLLIGLLVVVTIRVWKKD
jgi:NADH:ubiquinone oxidoreductase subunit 6 (subunit J)